MLGNGFQPDHHLKIEFCKQLHELVFVKACKNNASKQKVVHNWDKIIDFLMCSFIRFRTKFMEFRNYVPEEFHNSLAEIEFFGIQIKG